MNCPKEFTCALFAEGELPEAEAHEVALHLESCDACDRLVATLRAENRMLVQALQDIDLDASSDVPAFAASPSRSISVVGFALGVIGIAVAFKLSTGILFGFDLPAEVEWLNPRQWALSLGVAVNAGFYAFDNADSVFTDASQAFVLMSISAGILFAMARAFKRGGATAGSILGVALVSMGLAPVTGEAIDLRKGAAASIPATETIDDTVIAAPDQKTQSIDVAGTVKGDLIVIGDVVIISGNVEGNVIAGARRVEVTGTVGGSLLGVAHTVIISGRVGRNAIAAGDSMNVSRSGEIGGNTIIAGREAVIDGKTQRDLLTAAAIMDLRGEVGRNASLAVGQATVAGSSRVGGDLTARVGKEENVRVSEGAVITGQKNIRVNVPKQRPSPYLTVSFYVWQAVRVLGLFITGLVVFRMIPSLMQSGTASGSDWLKAGGVGFMTLVAVPVASIILAVTFIGFPIALITLILYLIACYLAKIVVAEFVGRSVMKNSGAVSLLVGLLLVILAVNLPWIGTLINFLLILLGLGAIALSVYKNVARRHAPAF